MFKNLIKKLFKPIHNMFREDNLAAAQIAQIFGSELLKVQQNAQTDSGTMPDIVKLNPKQFLVGETQFRSDRKSEEQRIIRALQMEAEAACPLPQETHLEQSPATPQPTAPSPVLHSQVLNAPGGGGGPGGLNAFVLERIATSLERIANAVDKVDIKTKKRTVKRKPKLSKTVLLNEINA